MTNDLSYQKRTNGLELGNYIKLVSKLDLQFLVMNVDICIKTQYIRNLNKILTHFSNILVSGYIFSLLRPSRIFKICTITKVFMHLLQ